MHRHEYSVPLEPARHNSLPRRSTLTRSAFSSPIPRIASTSTYEKPAPIIQPPGRVISEYRPRSTELSVRFQEPDSEVETMSDGGRSIANSEGSGTTVGGRKRRRRSARSSTAFQLAHPAPTLTQKQRLLHIRPKLLLQLQKLALDSRPKPAVDVLPSALVVPRLTKKFTRMFRGKAELGINDVMIVKSEDYDKPDNYQSVEPSDSDDDGLSNRELMAVICQMPKDLGGSQGKAEIVLQDGSVWVATPLPNNHYEFFSINDNTTARWVKRPSVRRSADFSTVASSFNNDFKFTFSVMNPNSRRHPIMASLTQSILDIPDHYVSVSSSAGKHPPTSPMGALHDDPSGDEEPHQERSTFLLQDDIKNLIQITGIWVALREGLSPYFRYDDAKATTTGRLRSNSHTRDSIRVNPSESVTSTPDSASSALGSVGGRLRKSCVKASPSTASPTQFEQNNTPKRSVSTGTAFMQRAAARRGNSTPGMAISDSEGEGMGRRPRRAATEDVMSGAPPYRRSATFTLPTRPGSVGVFPETPTQPRRRTYSPQRRTQSAYIPPNTSLAEHYRQSTELRSNDRSETNPPATVGEKGRASRWKAFTNFFRRSTANARPA